MYNPSSIDVLINRIGWYDAMPPTSLVIDAGNTQTESGVYANSFHSLATVENVYASLDNKSATNDTLNDILLKIKRDAVVDVLSKVYNLNTRATARFNNLIESLNYLPDYTDSIIVNKQYFDETLGLSMAVKALEYLRLTNRSNSNTTNPKLREEELFIALNGAYTQEGRALTKGLYAQYRESLGNLIDVLFPLKYPEGSEIIVDEDGNQTVKVKPKPILKNATWKW